nr:sigma factor binding protein 1, chloroplastic [Tanacetum cinerariifolium]GEX55956.1 sigma factor binding protein 1, chloroplastic [Tanacetum cinerariifolium]
MSKSNSGSRAVGKNPTREADDKSIKVKYISSPVLVEAKNASQFKEIVQHYTGQNPNEKSCSSVYSNPRVTKTDTATTTKEANSQFIATTNMDPEVGIDSFSWEEIEEWNQYQ